MKKLLAVTLALLMLLGCFGMTVAAEDEALSATVTVTVADQGALVVTQETVTVTDADEDGVLTINDALYAVHEAKYTGGAAAGYATEETQYGLSLTKLWGTANGGSYGYCVNNVSALSLVDPIREGDHVSAYAYADLTTWTDTYCYFDGNTVTAVAGKELTLTLSANSFDAEWNPIVVPVEGAVITVNGEATDCKTDKDGKATVTLETAGTVVLSATSETQTLVPPVCVATVEAAPAVTPETEPAPEPEKIPQTGAATDTLFAVLCLAGAAALMGVSKKVYAK